MEAMYGEPIRRRNEDLDPWIRFESWHMEGSIQGGICLNVRVGMDNAILGFDRKEALEASPGTYTNFDTGFIAEAEAGRLLRKKAVVEAREAAEAAAAAEAEAAGVDPEWAAEGQEWRGHGAACRQMDTVLVRGLRRWP